MPVVSKKEFRLPAQFGGRQYMKISFTSKSGMFFIDLPDVIASALRIKRIEDKTMDGVAERFKKSIEDFEKKKTTKKKVILVWSHTYHNEEGEDLDRRYEYHKIGFDFVVVNEYQFGDQNASYMTIPTIKSEKEEEVRAYGAAIIPWSQSHEDSLRLVLERFNQFSEKLKDVFGPIQDSGRCNRSTDYEKTAKKIIASLNDESWRNIA